MKGPLAMFHHWWQLTLVGLKSSILRGLHSGYTCVEGDEMGQGTQHGVMYTQMRRQRSGDCASAWAKPLATKCPPNVWLGARHPSASELAVQR